MWRYYFTISELIEAEQRMETDTPEITIVSLSLLLAIYRAFELFGSKMICWWGALPIAFWIHVPLLYGKFTEILLLCQYICFKTSYRVGADGLIILAIFPGDRPHDRVNG